MATTIADQEKRLSRRALTAVRNLRTLEAQKDDLDVRIKAQKAILTAELAPALGEKAVGVDGRGTKLVSVKVSVVRTINATLLRKRDPDLAEECTTESSRTYVTLAPVVA